MDFEQYIQIKTDSQPKGARSVALTGLASRRKIQLAPDLTLDQVSTIIKDHHQQVEGKIELFGNITGYSWVVYEYMKKTESKLFDVQGKFIKDVTAYDND